MADVIFEDNTIEVISAISEKLEATLEECAGEIESQAKRNTRVDTGKTKSSWRHRVTGSMMAAQHIATIGSSDENAIWEEFGTGEYALKGDGRKGGWVYKDEQYGCWWRTFGKKPSRAFWKAYTSLKNAIITKLQNSLKGL